MLSEPERRITQQMVNTEELGIGARLQVRGLRLEKRVAESLVSSVEELVEHCTVETMRRGIQAQATW